MGRLADRRRQREEETELNLVPVMNMFLVLIPFLLMSASFYQINAINTSVPVRGGPPAASEAGKPQKKAHKLTIVFELKENRVNLSALCDTLSTEALANLETSFTRGKAGAFSEGPIASYLTELKKKYPESDTVLLIPDADVSYNTIIQAMDCARKLKKEVLFPNVVLSASLG